MKSVDVVVDLETTGLSAGCCILSIGATTFDLEHQFYKRIRLTSCEEVGLVSNPDTMSWWDRQSAEAREEAFSGTEDILAVLGDFADFYRSLPGLEKNKFIWGNGADFDLPILGAAYEKVGMDKPWAPFNGRCYRTLKNLYFGVKAAPFEGVKHNALADAIHQAKHAREILARHFTKGD